MNPYQYLFEPIQIGSKCVKNRIFMPPISTNLAHHGYISDELVEHYRARAKGGVGLIVSEVVTVEPTYVYLPGDISIHDDTYIEGWKKVFDAVHEYKTLLLPQLFHPAYMAFPLPGTPQLIAPSHVGPYYAKAAPRPVTKEELKVIVKQFGDAAYRVKIAGGDGVEIHAAHAHGLLGGFLSPLYNKRTDEYGGDIHGRLKLVLEVIDEVRNRCGDDFIIDVRLSGDEYSDGGLNVNDATYIAKQLEKHGVDMLHISGGLTIKRGSSIPAPGTKMGSHAEVSRLIKKHVKIPVATVGRIVEAWMADELIANDFCDAVMIGRANLCDPEFVNKSMNQQEDKILPCIGCLRCLNGVMFGKPVTCSINPTLGEKDLEALPPIEEPKKILVMGGGPAGMQAAITLKQRGYHVVLCEKQDYLGGQLNLACVPIGKQEITKVIKNMIVRLKEVGVEVRLQCEVTKQMIKEEFSDYEVVVACGATPNTIKAFEEFHSTMSADDILSGKAFPGTNIVIIGGGSVGCELADYLAPLVNDRFPRNRKITLLEMANEVMLSETGPGRSLLVQRMMEKGIRIEVNAKVIEAKDDIIKYEQNGQIFELNHVDTLVFANGYHIDKSIEEMLCQCDVKFYMIGDHRQVGNLKDAIHFAYAFAKQYQ